MFHDISSYDPDRILPNSSVYILNKIGVIYDYYQENFPNTPLIYALGNPYSLVIALIALITLLTLITLYIKVTMIHHGIMSCLLRSLTP